VEESADPNGGPVSWPGSRVLVTGASSGIGAAIARDLAAQGATVGLCARRTELLEAVLDDCRHHSPDSKAWTIDLSDLDALDAFVHRVEEELGGIDVLVNNAGQTLSKGAEDTARSELEDQIRINYLSPVMLTRSALPLLSARGGRVVVVSSMAARTSTPGESAYSAAKSALSAYMEALAAERWFGSVRFHLVYPALIDLTPGIDGDDELAETSNGAVPIPAPVMARALRRGIDRGDFEIYVPETMRRFVAGRWRDVGASVEFMATLYREGPLH
jgi:NAD(P)-dependent dehydrogenase (short-subunit alcohol dehydrogenase family)